MEVTQLNSAHMATPGVPSLGPSPLDDIQSGMNLVITDLYPEFAYIVPSFSVFEVPLYLKYHYDRQPCK